MIGFGLVDSQLYKNNVFETPAKISLEGKQNFVNYKVIFRTRGFQITWPSFLNGWPPRPEVLLSLS